MSVEIRRVETKRDLRKFINFPFKVFKGNSCWIPPFYQD